jgi:hypothetical protein
MLSACDSFAAYSEILTTSGSRLLHYEVALCLLDKDEIKMIKVLSNIIGK